MSRALGWESRIDDVAAEKRVKLVRIYHQVPAWVDALHRWWDTHPLLWEVEKAVTNAGLAPATRVNVDAAMTCLDFACRAYWYRKLKAAMPVILFQLVHAGSLGSDLISDSRGFSSLPIVFEVLAKYGLPIHNDEKEVAVRAVLGQTGNIKGWYRRVFELYRSVVDVINVIPCLIRVNTVVDLRRLAMAGIPVAVGSSSGYYGRMVDGRNMLVPGRKFLTLSTVVGWQEDGEGGMLYYRVFPDRGGNYVKEPDGYPSGGWIEEYRLVDELASGNFYGMFIIAEPHSLDEVARLYLLERRAEA